MTERQAGIAGIAAFVVFWTALVSMAELRLGYSHYTKAISELGVIGAPNALAWNLIGFVAPGLLLTVCGAGLARSIDGRRSVLWWLLVLSGLAFASTGLIPAEMRGGSPLMQSPLTMGHVLMSFLSGIFWISAALSLPRRVRANPAWRNVTTLALVLALVSIAALTLNVFSQAFPYLDQRPGLAQRLAFSGYFLWFLIMSLYLFRAEQKKSRTSATS